MKDLNMMFEHAMSIVEKCNIQAGDIAEIKVSTRARRRYGLCSYKNGRYYITISEFILADDTIYKAVLETIIHEILHTCVGCMNHGKLWKHYANRIKRMTGYEVTRTSARSKFGLEPYEKQGKDNYVFVCEDCGQVIRRSRMSKFVKNYDLYRCGKCGGRLKYDHENSKYEVWTSRPRYQAVASDTK